jgi:diguanylate cyclase (GGDEF)-like protein
VAARRCGATSPSSSSAAIRGPDLAGRIGGDEFAVLLHGAEAASGEAVAARLLASLDTPVDAGEHLLFVKASIGLAQSATADTPEDVLRHADIAMYAAKERGKACCSARPADSWESERAYDEDGQHNGRDGRDTPHE